MISVFSEDLLNSSSCLADELRQRGIKTELYLDPKHKLDRQFKYADRKNIRYVVILGPEEAATNSAALKDLQTGDQVTLGVGEIADRIRA